DAPSCDWRYPAGKRDNVNKNRIFKHKGAFRWTGVKPEKYKPADAGWSSIVRNVLIGAGGETAKFHLRYFEIAPGGNSSLEHHRHEHVVVCIRGRGNVLIGKKYHRIGYLDTVYIAPDTVHELANPYDEPFGFFCIVNARRDRPKLVKRKTGRPRAACVYKQNK
ncbi:MAG: cupin domain-containing protein, partial [Nitrospirae bacterium]|nr:cupin domain-containing protein [Nitrospirota bacterium]